MNLHIKQYAGFVMAFIPSIHTLTKLSSAEKLSNKNLNVTSSVLLWRMIWFLFFVKIVFCISDDFNVYGVFMINFVNIVNDLDRFFAIPKSLLNHLFLRNSGMSVRLGSICEFSWTEFPGLFPNYSKLLMWDISDWPGVFSNQDMCHLKLIDCRNWMVPFHPHNFWGPWLRWQRNVLLFKIFAK